MDRRRLKFLLLSLGIVGVMAFLLAVGITSSGGFVYYLTVSEFLAEQGLRTDGLKPIRKTVTYHEPCHLCHAQNVSAQPRDLIKSIPGIDYRELSEASWCCGSAATCPATTFAVLARRPCPTATR